MARREKARLRAAHAERLWRERFGEPPPISDPVLMMKVLEELGGIPEPPVAGRARS